MKISAFIHAKGTSTRLENKNTRLLNGSPLICYAIKSALLAKKVDKTYIDSDSDEILEIGKELGAIPLKRPAVLANNTISGDDLMIWQAFNAADSDIIVQVVPTCPFTKSSSIDAAIDMLSVHELYNSVTGVRKEALYRWENDVPIYRINNCLPTSDKIQKTMYETMGLYIARTEAVITQKVRTPEPCLSLELGAIEAIDINTIDDLEFAEIVAEGLNNRILPLK